jgi:hypothetical protein
MPFAHEEISPFGGILKVQDESAPPIHERRAGHLSRGFEERLNFRRQGIRDELHGMDSMVDTEELHSVTGGGSNQSRHSMLFRPPTAKVDAVEDRTGRKAESTSFLLCPGPGTAIVHLTA